MVCSKQDSKQPGLATFAEKDEKPEPQIRRFKIHEESIRIETQYLNCQHSSLFYMVDDSLLMTESKDEYRLEKIDKFYEECIQSFRMVTQKEWTNQNNHLFFFIRPSIKTHLYFPLISMILLSIPFFHKIFIRVYIIDHFNLHICKGQFNFMHCHFYF